MVNVNSIGNVGAFLNPEGREDQHLTQPGDTMSGVAQAYGVTAQALAEANPFIANPNGLLPPGVYLKIPTRAEAERVGLKQREEEERERERRRRQEEEEAEGDRPPVSQLETVSNNPVANNKRNYELARGELSLAALSLASYDPGRTANPTTTGRFTREHLVADEAFINKNAITAADLQALFHEKGSGLATLILDDGRSAAQAITAIAVKNKINPQLLVTLLQRDGGFIVGKYARQLERERLDWAFGFGNGVEKYRGFERQLETAAGRLRQLYDMNLLRVPSHVIMDGARQRVENAATMAIYHSAPSQSLARLFFDVWHGFFGADGLGRPR